MTSEEDSPMTTMNALQLPPVTLPQEKYTHLSTYLDEKYETMWYYLEPSPRPCVTQQLLDDLKQFRQLHSITPGHPEYGHAPGVETTTGPLGQGFANAVGMAIAERRLAAEFNQPGHEIIDHWTYMICSDGDLQEGVASEACSLAGHLRLGRLNVLYDDNEISIDGPTELTLSDDVAARFGAYGWHVEEIGEVVVVDKDGVVIQE